MIGGNRRFAGLGFGHRYRALLAESEQFLFGVGIEDAAARYDERPFRRAQSGDRLLQFLRIRSLSARTVQALLEEALGIVIGLRLHVLAEGEGDGAAFGRIS